MIPMNLIPRERILARRIRRARRAWLVSLGVYAALIGAACLLVNLPVNAESPRVRADLDRLAERLAQAERGAALAEKSIVEKRARLAAAKAVGEHPDWSIFLEAVARARHGEIVLESFDLTTTRVEIKARAPAPSATGSAPVKPGAKPKARTVYVVKLVGYSPAPGGVFAFARKLEGMGVFDQVNVKDTRAVALGAMPMTRFEIQATIPEPSEDTR